MSSRDRHNYWQFASAIGNLLVTEWCHIVGSALLGLSLLCLLRFLVVIGQFHGEARVNMMADGRRQDLFSLVTGHRFRGWLRKSMGFQCVSCLQLDTVHRAKQVLISVDIFFGGLRPCCGYSKHEVMKRIFGAHSFFLFVFVVSWQGFFFSGTVLKLKGLWFFHVGKVADVYDRKYSNKVCIVPFEPCAHFYV